MIDRAALMDVIQQLEPLPASVTRLARIVASEASSLDEIQEVIEFDPVLTGRLLRTANSAHSGSRRPIATVKDAVLRMGTGIVLTLAVGSHVRQTMMEACPGFGLAEGVLWRHGVAAALTTELLQTQTHLAIPPESLTASLLHDVGKLVLSRVLPPDLMRQIRKVQEDQHVNRLQAEREILGFHHGELGGDVADYWKLPEPIRAGIVHHHTPDRTSGIMAYITCFANLTAESIENTTGRLRAVPEDPTSVYVRLGIGTDDPQRVQELVAGRLDEVRERYK